MNSIVLITKIQMPRWVKVKSICLEQMAVINDCNLLCYLIKIFKKKSFLEHFWMTLYISGHIVVQKMVKILEAKKIVYSFHFSTFFR